MAELDHPPATVTQRHIPLITDKWFTRRQNSEPKQFSQGLWPRCNQASEVGVGAERHRQQAPVGPPLLSVLPSFRRTNWTRSKLLLICSPILPFITHSKNQSLVVEPQFPQRFITSSTLFIIHQTAKLVFPVAPWHCIPSFQRRSVRWM